MYRLYDRQMFEWRNYSCHTAHRIRFHYVVQTSKNISLSLSIYKYIYIYISSSASETRKQSCEANEDDDLQLHQWIRNLSNGCAATLTSRSSSPAGKTQAHFLRQIQDALCLRFRFGIQIPWDGHASPPSTGNIGMINALLQANWCLILFHWTKGQFFGMMKTSSNYLRYLDGWIWRVLPYSFSCTRNVGTWEIQESSQHQPSSNSGVGGGGGGRSSGSYSVRTDILHVGCGNSLLTEEMHLGRSWKFLTRGLRRWWWWSLSLSLSVS